MTLNGQWRVYKPSGIPPPTSTFFPLPIPHIIPYRLEITGVVHNSINRFHDEYRNKIFIPHKRDPRTKRIFFFPLFFPSLCTILLCLIRKTRSKNLHPMLRLNDQSIALTRFSKEKVNIFFSVSFFLLQGEKILKIFSYFLRRETHPIIISDQE